MRELVFVDRGACLQVRSVFQASQLIKGVSLCLFDYASFAGEIDYFDLMELVGRLDLAVEAIDSLNGALK